MIKSKDYYLFQKDIDNITDVIEHLTLSEPKKPFHELRYGGEIYALSKDCETLMFLKAKATLYKLVQYPELLRIYFEGVSEWIFDHYLDEKEASKIVAGAEV